MSERDNNCTYTILLTEGGKLSKEFIFKAIKNKFNFPDYFGNNWDAVYDLMIDYIDGLIQAETVCFLVSDDAEIDEEELNKFISVLDDVVEYANDQGVGFNYMIKR